MDKKIIGLAAFMGGIAVILGAFGAHGLKAVLDENQLLTFETGVRYQIYHALFLLFVGAVPILTSKTKKIIGYLVGFGVLFFSGSIYLLATNGLTAVDFKFLGPITPLGGVLLIAAWFTVGYQAIFVKKGI
ncbi:DUF423 domain-containing protein [Flavobacterium sp. HSC-61S13]|uniref:DUF423 domain-containing protein n=1 Tax=Flavobacterium sp. HSC-61S13 TaxID=2910963 RepID=UPI00209D118D|nr:DUF423 domain-containing protein [Flavobacterium sp. HSC-61S13]MCP1995316.1 uncharacterized membrane protein YgdD (TMEM256/DUF423 family) [Flavobacterium sp. HSC-61S13]